MRGLCCAAALSLGLAGAIGAQALPPVRVPAGNAITPEKALLGKALFWDEQLSSTRTVACGTCHVPSAGGTDPRAAGAVHPGADGVFGTPDDVQLVNDLHLPVNEEIVLSIKSQDVLHSFFLPNLRVKQDVVPGMKQFVWFQATQSGVYDIVCAELCGWGHYKMRGRLTVEPREKFDAWLGQQQAEQNRAGFTPAAAE